ncbi:MAG: hypothetical protein QME40_00190 [bacterium]|nr:hypothetical protein [bacterium]
MISRFMHWVAIFASLLNGVTTFLKFFGAISGSNLFVIVVTRMMVTFIIFCGIGFIIKRIVSYKIPQLLETGGGLGGHVDYSLPATSPVTEGKKKEQAEEEK